MLPQDQWSTTTIALIIRVLYLGLAFGIIIANSIPSLRSRFITYGARASNPHPASKSTNAFDRVLNLLQSLQVPHSWFYHFYLVSILCSLFWILYLPPAITQNNHAWLLMFIQGGRRLYETLRYTKSKGSTSTMWIGHWAVGIIFYMAMNMAVWIEGPSQPVHTRPISTMAFLAASIVQNRAHRYLSTLQGYVVPTHWTFTRFRLLCPHYAAEVVLYATLARIAAPVGYAVNWTVMCGWLFVHVNLAVTAAGTKKWYASRFGADKIGTWYALVPALF